MNHPSSLDALRTRIDAFHARHAALRLDHAVSAAEPESHAALADLFRWTRTYETLHLVETAASFLPSPQVGALATHVVQMMGFVRNASLWDRWDEFWTHQPALRAAQPNDAAFFRSLAEAAQKAAPIWRDLMAPDEGLPPALLALASRDSDSCSNDEALVKSASEWLEHTDHFALAQMEFLGARTNERRFSTAGDLVLALRYAVPGEHVDRLQRWPRLTAAFSNLGFGAELSSRVRARRSTRPGWPLVSAYAVSPPSDVRMVTSAHELGLISELSECAVAATALALALGAPGLPSEHRWPTTGTTMRAFGALIPQLYAIASFNEDRFDLTRSATEQLTRGARALVTFSVRLAAARLLASHTLATDGPDAAASALERAACGSSVPTGLAICMTPPPTTASAEFRAATAALWLHWTLRERFDEDWYQNPRVREPLRYALSRGGALSVESFCEELGSESSARPLSLAALFD